MSEASGAGPVTPLCSRGRSAVPTGHVPQIDLSRGDAGVMANWPRRLAQLILKAGVSPALQRINRLLDYHANML